MNNIAQLRAEVARRRTFAIISHPDAGKTTLTEKLLLHGGAIHLAGSVKQRRSERHATSDWMEIEKQRGISVTTSVLQFQYAGRHLNLLDTPGHNDFSEDTYRTLAAVDSAIMLIDNVKGVEPQTIKLFEVCRLRRVPIVTFINKLDRTGRDPIDLLDEIERVLGIPCSPANWPVGSGPSFQGVVDRWRRCFLRFERVGVGGSRKALIHETPLDDPALPQSLGADEWRALVDELELMDAAGNGFDHGRYLAGEVTPVFFGSAMTNFGVQPFLDAFVELAPPPRPRPTSRGELAPDAPEFTGFVFKIQANMDPRHRDRIAFVRICSGAFHRGMEVYHPRSGKTLTLNRSLQFLAQDRTIVDHAYSGDVIGLWDPGVLRIGDTLCTGTEPLEFEGIPRFSPEHFVRVRLADPLKRKQLRKGLEQLSEEGTLQLFYDRRRQEPDPLLGAVGVLQFEVAQHRLNTEYGVPVQFEPLPYRIARWIGSEYDLNRLERPGHALCVIDIEDRPLVLFDNEWSLRAAERTHENLHLLSAVQPGRRARG